MTQQQKDANWRRLCGGKPAPKPIPEYPTAVCELSSSTLHKPAKVIWKQKFGVWFFTNWESPLTRLDDWGDTLPAFNRMLHHMNYSVRWLIPFTEAQKLTPVVP